MTAAQPNKLKVFSLLIQNIYSTVFDKLVRATPSVKGAKKRRYQGHEFQLDDEWPESIFHHVGSQSVSYLLSVQCEVLSRVS